MNTLQRCGLALCASMWATAAVAIPVTATYTDSTLFDQLIHSDPHWKNQSTLNFDSIPAGAPIPSGSTIFGSGGTGVHITYSMGGLEMKVSNVFDTTSGHNYLGLNDPSNYDQFVAGDKINFTFTNPISALGMFFITGDALLSSDIQLVTALGTAESSDIAQYQLADGGYAYFLGFASLTPEFTFAAAQIRFADSAPGAFLYNIDNITTARVPEPATLWLFAGGALLMVGLRRRR